MNLSLGEQIAAERMKKGLNKAQLAALLEISPAAIGQFEKGKNNPKTEVLLKLGRLLEYDFVNNRPMGQEESKVYSFNEPEVKYNVTTVKAQMVPIYNIEFSVGVLSTLLQNKDDHFPIGYLSIPEVSGCDAIIKVKGDNMAGKINSGDWVGVKRLDKDQWFPFGYIYAIETEQAQVIKYIKKGSVPEMVKITSHNKFYEDDEIPRDVIKELWSVKTVLPFSKIETLM